MRKIILDLNALKVESFSADGEMGEGTVAGASGGDEQRSFPNYCGSGDTCDASGACCTGTPSYCKCPSAFWPENCTSKVVYVCDCD